MRLLSSEASAGQNNSFAYSLRSMQLLDEHDEFDPARASIFDIRNLRRYRKGIRAVHNILLRDAVGERESLHVLRQHRVVSMRSDVFAHGVIRRE